MLKLLHISDLHFGPPYLSRVGESLQRMAREVDPDVVVASGDFTQRAREEQFAEARAFLDRLPSVPKVVVPGNHDVPLYRWDQRWSNPHQLYRKYINEELNCVWRLDGAVLVALDSTSPRRAITNGRIEKEQLQFCREAFAGTPPDAVRVVVAHHHFAPAPDFERDQTMPRAKRAMKEFIGMDVDLILGGHLHRAYIGDSLDVYPGLRSGHQGIIIVQCGTTTSRRGRGRERERNTFNVIKIDPTTIYVVHYMYFDDLDAFEPISRHAFPRRSHRGFSAD